MKFGLDEQMHDINPNRHNSGPLTLHPLQVKKKEILFLEKWKSGYINLKKRQFLQRSFNSGRNYAYIRSEFRINIVIHSSHSFISFIRFGLEDWSNYESKLFITALHQRRKDKKKHKTHKT